MCAEDAHICSVFVLHAKGPIRAPFCQWAAVRLCAEQATGPFSVCVYNSHSVSTHRHTCCHFPPSASFSLLFCIFQSHFLPVFLCYSCFCSSNSVGCLLSLGLWPEALCKATRKRLLAMLVYASMLYSFQKLPFLHCDLQS